MTVLSLIGMAGADYAALGKRSDQGGFDDGSLITDAATLEELQRLEEYRLGDIGVTRKSRRTRWQSLARGMDPVGTVEFDYFRLRR